jgi:uncharacterized protein (TIGR00255 family)
MTGYASATAPAASQANSAAENTLSAGSSTAAVSVELRSVNSRFLDLAFRMPDELRALEPALRELLGATLRRGKIELRLSTRSDGDGASSQPAPEQLQHLAHLETTVQAWLPRAASLSVHEALQWCKGTAPLPKLDEVVLAVAQRACAGLSEAREREGEKLVAILMERIERLRRLALEAQPLVPQVVQRQQQRFLERWQEALNVTGGTQSVPAQTLQERAMSEAAAYALRIDVAEELSRLAAHLEEIARLLRTGGEIGKRLDFLIQELHREANTLGSKSAALELTQISVEMKVLIEQMREQVQNIE